MQRARHSLLPRPSAGQTGQRKNDNVSPTPSGCARQVCQSICFQIMVTMRTATT